MSKKLVFNNREYKVIFKDEILVDGIQCDGCCDNGGNKREIHILKSLRGQQRLGATLHEFFHAEFPKMSEKAVLRCEKDFMKGLIEMGYRR